METRIIKAVFGASKSIVAPKRFKNDWGQVLELVGITLPQTFTAHFANSKTGMAKKRIGQSNQVDVPDEFFTSGADIYCWVMVHDTVSDGRTMYTVRIPIEDRGTATDEEPTPVQQDVIDQAIAALNSAVEKTAQDVESADASAQSAKADADRAETARDTTEEYVSTVQGYAQQAQTSATNASSSAMASANSASQAQQIKTDVEGMVDEAQSAAGASAQSALESEQSASQASAFATFASQSADTASTKASEASASAQTASAKATEASEYASTASIKASEASQSASAASGYATAAGQAKTAAETAQGLAEQAQSDAESAKDDAESARDTAQQIVSGISGKVEQIDQNTADIASLEADRYKAYVTDTATGAVASFSDGANNIPMVDVLVNIDPMQDLHGYDNPWPAGGGVNKFDESVFTNYRGSLQANGVWHFDTLIDILKKVFWTAPESIGQITVTMWRKQSGVGTQGFRLVINYTDGTSVKVGNNNATGGTDVYSVTTDASKTVRNIVGDYGSNQYSTDVNVVVSIGSTAPSAYAPYSNICPISGWTGAQVNHSGADTSNPTTYPITFPTEAGTVYGGTLDITTGVLTVDRAMVDLGTLRWTISPASPNRVKCTLSDATAPPSGAIVPTNVMFSDMTLVKANTSLTKYGQIAYLVLSGDHALIAYYDGVLPTGQLVYELATPITYQLTPTEIRSLLGTNNVFADTGDSTVEYRADTKLYINKKIAEAISALS